MSDRGFYYEDLVGILEIYIGNYEQDREKYWKEENEEIPLADMLYDQAERFAQSVLNGTKELVSTEQLDKDLRVLDKELVELYKWDKSFNRELEEIFKSEDSLEKQKKRIIELYQQKPSDAQEKESPLRLVWERLYIKMCWDAVSKIESGTNKILQLYSLILQYSPSEPTRAFLTRLSRCYVFGFDPECIILCRSVIDTAFRETVNDEICEKHCRIKRKQQFTLADRIHAALKEGIIDKNLEKIARVVKMRGDQAVHYQPDITKEVWQTIRDTVVVLEGLYAN